jgi:hypothetical protein
MSLASSEVSLWIPPRCHHSILTPARLGPIVHGEQRPGDPAGDDCVDAEVVSLYSPDNYFVRLGR